MTWSPGTSRLGEDLGVLRVVAVGMVDSVHFARWLQIFENENIEFYIFASGPNRRIHPLLVDLITRPRQGRKASYHLKPMQAKLSLLVWVLDKFMESGIRSYWLRKQIERVGPDYVHALELQNAGYTAAEALEKISPRPRLIITNYGSDLFWFSRFPRHLEKIKKLLLAADRYSAECHRDVVLAKQLGFSGEILPVLPNAGGFSKNVLSGEMDLDEARNLILVKGYQGWVGRAKIAVEAIRAIANNLAGVEVVFYSCNRSTIAAARGLARLPGLEVTTYKKNQMTHDEMLALFSKAKVYVGLSLSDGISTSMLEAMAMGAIPVQTSTACCDEWFDETGVKVQVLSVAAVADAILEGIELAKDPSNRITNRETIRSKASEDYVRDAALEFYR